jgi:hypothetical protein
MMQKTTEIHYDPKIDCGYAFTGDGTKFLFDMADAGIVASRGWHLSKRGYIAGKEKRRERPLHKLLITVDSGLDIDHISRNKLDNRRSNLRVCDHHENCFNQSLRRNNTTGYIGVSFARNVGKYESYIHCDGVKYGLGYYASPEEAAFVRDSAALSMFGEFSRLNFAEGRDTWWEKQDPEIFLD